MNFNLSLQNSAIYLFVNGRSEGVAFINHITNTALQPKTNTALQPKTNTALQPHTNTALQPNIQSSVIR